MLSVSVDAQSPEWMWAQSAGYDGNDNLENIATDSNGNVYVVGYFSSQFITFGLYILENAGFETNDIFIAKYSQEGDVLWAMSAGGSNDDRAISVAVDNSGNLYVAGYFASNSIHFDSLTLVNNNPDYSNFFLVKFTSDGEVIWARTSTDSPYNDFYNYVYSDNQGNIYATGGFGSYSISFNTTTLYNFQSGTDDVLIVKYDSSGNFIWAKSGGGDYYDMGNVITADIYGNVWVCGQFTSSFIYFENTIHENENPGLNDVFINQYDSLGNLQWSHCAGGNNGDFPLTIVPDNNGNAFIGGYFKSYFITFGNYTLNSWGSPYGDLFLVKYSTGGEALWAINSIDSPSSDAINSLCMDTSGNLYATGHFQSQDITFGNITLHNSNPPGQEIFVVKFNESGIVDWAITAKGEDHDEAFSIALNNSGNVIIGGRFFSETLCFGPNELTNYFPGLNDVFVAKYSSIVNTNERVEETGSTMFPNPFTESFEIILQSHLKRDPVELIMYNNFGQRVGNEVFANEEPLILKRPGLTSGLYTIVLLQNSRVIEIMKAIVKD